MDFAQREGPLSTQVPLYAVGQCEQQPDGRLDLFALCGSRRRAHTAGIAREEERASQGADAAADGAPRLPALHQDN